MVHQLVGCESVQKGEQATSNLIDGAATRDHNAVVSSRLLVVLDGKTLEVVTIMGDDKALLTDGEGNLLLIVRAEIVGVSGRECVQTSTAEDLGDEHVLVQVNGSNELHRLLTEGWISSSGTWFFSM